MTHGNVCKDATVEDCLECPRKHCRYDYPLPQKDMAADKREHILALLKGSSVQEGAKITGLTTRTLYRYQKLKARAQRPVKVPE